MRVASIQKTTCPRCHVPVEGDFKYCPECAFRLRPGLQEPPEAPTPAGPGTLVLAIVGLALLVGGIVVGVFLFGGKKERPVAVPRPN